MDTVGRPVDAGDLEVVAAPTGPILAPRGIPVEGYYVLIRHGRYGLGEHEVELDLPDAWRGRTLSWSLLAESASPRVKVIPFVRMRGPGRKRREYRGRLPGSPLVLAGDLPEELRIGFVVEAGRVPPESEVRVAFSCVFAFSEHPWG